ncbi:methyl-accepting chemotaxis protein [Geotalea uraniireducens]|uniref:Methyl-accepting chemotaxis protein n=1 Tax=Geotalea uraniireducens TaxID=351604 RepID=A0ABN6VW84_9BACT|nr:methyl-accepting chemotaxis protein [Geotalea uraniireducens]BDV44604.1 methyl-accepting chemotaxis protein [Geotalea uraniireducens]
MRAVKAIRNLYLNLSVKTKLLFFTIFSLSWLIIIGGVGVWSGKTINRGASFANSTIKEIVLFNGMKNDFLFLRLDLAHMTFLQDSERFNAALHDAEQRLKIIAGAIDQANRRTDLDATEKEAMKTFADAFKEYQEYARKLIELEKTALAANTPQARQAVTSFIAGNDSTLFQDAGDAVTDLIDHNEQVNLELSNRNQKSYRTQSAVMGGVVALATVLGLFFGWLISRSIIRPLEHALAVVVAVENGDLTREVPVDTRDDFGRLAEGVNGMIEQTRSVVTHLMDHAHQIEGKAASLYGNSVQLATAAEEIASQASTVAVASEEMSATAHDIACNCGQAATSATEVNQAAASGAEVVAGTVATMEEIAGQVNTMSREVQELGRRSDEIGEIVGTIQDIADQTNLLALNAAIEAARAGEHGRGFAVVADEVRSLAEKTTQATKSIGGMIKTIQNDTASVVTTMGSGVKRVESGTAEAGRSGEALARIRSRVDELECQISQVATAAEQQSATTAEISGNIGQISTVVQDASIQAQQSAENAQILNGLSEELKRLVGRFRVA